MAFIFTMHSHRRAMPSSGTLPAISEDGQDFAITPDPRATPRTPPARPPWARNPVASPLSYKSLSSDGSGSDTDPDREKHLASLRNNPAIAKRGGWRKLALIAVVVALCLVGLIVGLVVGLKAKNSSSTSNDASGSSSNVTWDSTAFPAGSYAVQTYLSSMTTNCTSNPNTWRCYPYAIYADSAASAAATFSWIIAMNEPATNPPTYSISSTENPFSIVFSAMPLTLIDSGQSTEHYSFVLTSMNKPVVPGSPITSANIAATCYFNQTSLEARLYTKMAQTYPASLGSSSGTSNNSTSSFKPWPYAAYVDQSDSGGPDVPQCFDNQGNAVGSFVAETGGECNCLYQNYGT